jgi:hypothetical protein
MVVVGPQESMSDPQVQRSDEQPVPAGRSGDIEIICALGLLVALFVIPQSLAAVLREGASWRSLLGVTFPLVFAACLIGLWRMRRWAVFTYAGVWALSQILLVSMGQWSVLTVPVPALVIAVGFRNLWRMR